MTFEEWRAGAVGRGMDPDGVYGYQCVDVPKDYAMAIFPGVSWIDSIGYGNAKDLFAGSNTQYFDKIANDSNDPNQLPQQGDIIVYNAFSGNPYGHIAVVVSADTAGVTIVEQNGFTPTLPAYQKTRAWGALPCIGWLRPKLAPAAAPNQRVVGNDGVNYRDQPNQTGNVLKTFTAGDVLDLKGFVHGEAVDGNDIWFVGQYTGGYLWSGAFTDTSTNALPDLTPLPPATPSNQRTVGSAGVNYRKYPATTADVLKSFGEGETLDFDAFTHAETVSGNNVWFRGKYTGGWAWSGAFTDAGAAGLVEVDPPALPSTPNQPPINPTYSSRPSVPNTLWGVDVSSYQGDIDWGKLVGVIDFAMLRAGHVGEAYGGGDNRTDVDLAQNKAGARQAGIPIGYYYYVYLTDDPKVEAQRFVASIGDVADSEPVVFDIEDNDPNTVDKTVWTATFEVEVGRLTGKPCHLYTYQNYAKNNSGLAVLVTAYRKLWLANYDVAPGGDLSGQPLGTPIMHQYTSKGSLAGINGAVDLNVFYGTTDDFKALGKPIIIPAPNPTPPVPTPPTPPSNTGGQLAKFFKAIIEALSKIFKKRS